MRRREDEAQSAEEFARMMPTPAREFTDIDWMAFTRTQPWAARSHAWGCANDLGAPLIRELQNGTVVCGSAVCEFYEGEDKDRFAWGVRFPTQMLARLFVDALPHDLTGEQAHSMGFAAL
jgi:hypothetical protein